MNNVNRLLYLNLIEKKEPVKRYRGVTVDVFFFRVEQGFMGCLVLKNYWRIKNLQEFNVKECMQAG